MCRVEVQSKRGAQGIAECDRALALNPNLAAAHAQIGLAKVFDGHPEETESHELEALRVSPHDTEASSWVAYIALAKLHLGAYERRSTGQYMVMFLRAPAPLGIAGTACACAGHAETEELGFAGAVAGSGPAGGFCHLKDHRCRPCRKLPIFGVCLGVQAIGEYFGGKLGQLGQPAHGRPSQVEVRGGRLMQNLPAEIVIGRYHSLYVERDSMPEVLSVTASTEDGVAMAIEHKTLPVGGSSSIRIADVARRRSGLAHRRERVPAGCARELLGACRREEHLRRKQSIFLRGCWIASLRSQRRKGRTEKRNR